MNLISVRASTRAAKGTQVAKLLQDEFRPHPAIDRRHAARGGGRPLTELGNQCKRSRSAMDKGDLVPDEVVIGIIAQRLDKPDCAKGAIFDGFCSRPVAQARALDCTNAGRPPQPDRQAVIELKVDDEAMVGADGKPHPGEGFRRGPG